MKRDFPLVTAPEADEATVAAEAAWLAAMPAWDGRPGLPMTAAGLVRLFRGVAFARARVRSAWVFESDVKDDGGEMLNDTAEGGGLTLTFPNYSASWSFVFDVGDSRPACNATLELVAMRGASCFALCPHSFTGGAGFVAGDEPQFEGRWYAASTNAGTYPAADRRGDTFDFAGVSIPAFRSEASYVNGDENVVFAKHCAWSFRMDWSL